jgi:polyhydroxyalkanoate synthesis regulator phasin
MFEVIRKTLLTGLGLAAISKEKAEKIVEPLVKKGHLSDREGKKFLDELIKKSEQARKALEKTVDGIVQKTLSKFDIPTKRDYETLLGRIERLEKEGKAKTKVKRKSRTKRSVAKK